MKDDMTIENLKNAVLYAKGTTRIRRCKAGVFRLDFALEDILVDAVIKVEPERRRNALIPEDREEEVGIMVLHALPYASFGIYYHSKITDLESNFFTGLVHRLMWMNFGLDFEGYKNLTEHIHSYWVKDKVKITKRMILKKLLDTTPVLIYNTDAITMDRVTLFARKSLLTKEEKQSISLKYRASMNHGMIKDLIHSSAMQAIECNDTPLIVSRRQVFDIAKHDKLKSIKTFNRLIEPKTVTALEEHNVTREFKTPETYDKYQKFLSLPKCRGNREVSRILKISLTTVGEFKDLRDNG